MAAPMKFSSTLAQHIYSKECALIRRSLSQSTFLSCRKVNTESVTSIRDEDNIVKTKPRIFSRAQKISRAMRAYLEKAKNYEQSLSEFGAEYESGRRHLANMMGKHQDDFTHEDIKRAVSYLLPSGLHEPKARPVVQLPEDILPLRKVAQFGSDGRPFHFLFYTCRPAFYEILYNVTQKIESLRELEGEMHMSGKTDIGDKKLNLLDSEWISYGELIKSLKDERVSEDEYDNLIRMLSRLAAHPLNYKEEEFIMKYRKNKQRMSIITKTEIKELEDGTSYTIAIGKRKTSVATVKLFVPGTGKFSVNGQSILYFPNVIHREQIMYPLDFTDKLMEVDIEAEVTGGGATGQSGAIRNGIARALMGFVDDHMVESMRQAGLLTTDLRRRERKKPFKRGARRGRTWKAR